MENRLRLDLLIAVFALLLSAVASTASVYQAHVISRQFSATVWPYLTVTTTNSATALQLSITNDGLGPAIIRSASMAWDGTKSFSSWRGMVTTLVALSPPPKAIAARRFVATLSTSSLDPGDVIRAGDSRSMFSLRGWNGFPALLEGNAISQHLTLSICYCSLLGTCWIKKWTAQSPNSIAQQDIEPYEVRACPAPRGIAPGAG